MLSPRGGKFLVALGLLMLLIAIYDWLQPRPHYVSSHPEPGTTAATPPAAVIIRFNDPLDANSTVSVVSTVTLTPSGEKTYAGKDVTISSGVELADPPPRSLRANLQSGLPAGLYRVDWRAVAARGKAWRYGTFYFGIGMPAPAHVFGFSGGPLYERDGGLGSGLKGAGRQRRTLLLAGMLLISLGLLLPRLRPRR